MSEIPVEEAVRALDKLRKEHDRIESYRRQLRLGDGVELRDERTLKEIWWRAIGYAGGHLGRHKPEPMADRLQTEFYEFLGQKANRLADQINKATAELAAFAPKDGGHHD